MNCFQEKRIPGAPIILLVAAFAWLAGCASHHEKAVYDPVGKLAETLVEYEVAEREINCESMQNRALDCEGLASALAELQLQYPNNSSIALSGAIVYFQLGRYQDSQVLLDQLLAQPYANPEAAVLRSQIALMEGNFSLARSVLSRQIQLVPDNPELYGAKAASYYLEGRYEKARTALQAADRLGMTNWRTHYHMGLLYEAQEQWSMACHHYAKVLAQQPDHSATLGRLLMLSGHSDCKLPPSSVNIR